mgnify:CR=1 FL=1
MKRVRMRFFLEPFARNVLGTQDSVYRIAFAEKAQASFPIDQKASQMVVR